MNSPPLLFLTLFLLITTLSHSISPPPIYFDLASILSPRLTTSSSSSSDAPPPPLSTATLASIIQTLSRAPGLLKTLDGAAYEAYQRTHKNTLSASSGGLGVSGRATRSANRIGAAADAFWACELCDGYVRDDDEDDDDVTEGNQKQRQQQERVVRVVNATLKGYQKNNDTDDESQFPLLLPLSVTIHHETKYNGGAGLSHGGIDGLLSTATTTTNSHHNTAAPPRPPRGRLIITIRCDDHYENDLNKTIRYLDVSPERVVLTTGLVAEEMASVHGGLWRCANAVLEEIVRPILMELLSLDKTTTRDDGNGTTTVTEKKRRGETEEDVERVAVHFVGRGLAGGVCALAAAILDGTLPAPPDITSKMTRKAKRTKKRRTTTTTTTKGNDNNKDKSKNDNDDAADDDDDTPAAPPPPIISGMARGITSAVTLGPPPCISSNIKINYVTTLIHGDDIIPRTTRESLDRLCRRIRKTASSKFRFVGGFGLSEALSVTVRNLKTHARGREGEESRLNLPGKAFLMRPRRLDGKCSMHDVGSGGGSGREAIRARVLWQLDDILLSPSLWRHHWLRSYIEGLDRLQLRHLEGMEEEEEG